MNEIKVREVRADDYPLWRRLWDAYNAFYGRSGDKALPEAVTAMLWRRLNDSAEPMRALVGERDGRLCGLAHLIFHRSTSATGDVCYLQDLYVAPDARRGGMGMALMSAASETATANGCARLYWHTLVNNRAARKLYDRIARRTNFVVYRQDMN